MPNPPDVGRYRLPGTFQHGDGDGDGNGDGNGNGDGDGIGDGSDRPGDNSGDGGRAPLQLDEPEPEPEPDPEADSDSDSAGGLLLLPALGTDLRGPSQGRPLLGGEEVHYHDGNDEGGRGDYEGRGSYGGHGHGHEYGHGDGHEDGDGTSAPIVGGGPFSFPEAAGGGGGALSDDFEDTDVGQAQLQALAPFRGGEGRRGTAAASPPPYRESPPAIRSAA